MYWVLQQAKIEICESIKFYKHKIKLITYLQSSTFLLISKIIIQYAYLKNLNLFLKVDFQGSNSKIWNTWTYFLRFIF